MDGLQLGLVAQPMRPDHGLSQTKARQTRWQIYLAQSRIPLDTSLMQEKLLLTV